MTRPFTGRLLLGALALGLAALLSAGACAGGSDSERDQLPALPGTLLDARPAPDFALVDQDGETVKLSSLNGRIVVLTFMYTNCPDYCPATAEKLRATLERLGADAARVQIVAVSVDPEHDDAAAARTFLATHRLPAGTSHFLVGPRERLEAVWASFGIARIGPGSGAPGSAAPSAVGHTEAIYIIDTEGRERTLLRGDFDPAALATGIKTLVK